MKAITYEAYGGPDVFKLKDVPKPICHDDEVLIRVRAAEATKADCELRRFKFSVKWFWLPLRLAVGILKPRKPVLGGYFAGEIVQVGKDVTELTVGDAVFGSGCRQCKRRVLQRLMWSGDRAQGYCTAW